MTSGRPGPQPAPSGLFVAGCALFVIDMLSFGPFVSDYSRYLPDRYGAPRLIGAVYGGATLGSVDGCLPVLVDGGLVDAERASNANSRHFACVNQTVDGHLGDAHNLGDLRDRQKGSLFFICHIYLTLQLVTRCRLPLPQDFTHVLVLAYRETCD